MWRTGLYPIQWRDVEVALNAIARLDHRCACILDPLVLREFRCL
jgi:hypothetical protein